MSHVFRAIASTVVPEAAQLDAVGWSDFERIVDAALTARSVAVRRQLALFLQIVQWLPVLRYGRGFTGLAPAHRARVLAWFERAPLQALRRGLWGVRTLVFLGYYGRPAAAAAIGYRADPRGWEART